MKLISIISAALMAGPCLAATKQLTLTKANTLIMDKEFTAETVAHLSIEAKNMDLSLPAGQPIVLVLNTPGGSIFAGLELIENLNSLNRKVDTVTIFSASMGFQTVQHLKGDRFITGNGTLMSHKARGGFEGEFPGQLDSRYRYVLGVVTGMDVVAANRSNKHSLKSYQDLIENEYWCSPADCIRNGFVDQVVELKCDRTLSGTHDEVVDRVNFFGIEIFIIATLADCPTITTPLAIRAKSSLGDTEATLIKKLTKEQRIVLQTLKSKAINKYTEKAKRVSYTEIK